MQKCIDSNRLCCTLLTKQNASGTVQKPPLFTKPTLNTIYIRDLTIHSETPPPPFPPPKVLGRNRKPKTVTCISNQKKQPG